MKNDGAEQASGEVRKLRPSQTLPPEPPPTPATGLHGAAISAMAVFALLGIGLMLALITVNWTDASRRVVTILLVLAVIGFMASASMAVFAAARDTHRLNNGSEEE